MMKILGCIIKLQMVLWIGARVHGCGCPPDVPNTEVIYSGLLAGDMATYKCVEEYLPSETNVTIECSDSGMWSTDYISCEVDGCGFPPKINNSEVNEGSTAIGSTRSYTCSHGYYMWGKTNTISCRQDGYWSTILFDCHEVVNIALKRQTFQSSIYEEAMGHCGPENAVDGNKYVDYSRCAVTADGDMGTWWMVDFGQEAVVIGMSLLNRDSCGNRLANLDMFVGSNESHIGLCTHYNGPPPASEAAIVICDSPLTGRFLRIIGGGTDCDSSQIFIQICEVEVFGFFPVPIQCDPGSFECYTHLCIPLSSHCDYYDDCGDDSDEDGCPPPNCDNGMFWCDDKCINGSWVCDFYNDCEDGTDEADCNIEPCGATQFQCDNGQCLESSDWYCDLYADCLDGSDEADCGDVSCDPPKFLCSDGSLCVPDYWVCDDFPDCPDWGDEQNCYYGACTSSEFLCYDSSKCVPDYWICDAYVDCPDGSDEHTC